MKKKYIKDILLGEAIQDDLFLIDQYDLQTSKNGSTYIKLKLKDKTGMIDAKIWENALPYCAEAQKGDIVRISGTVDTYNGALQCIIGKLKKESDVDLSDFIPSSKRPGIDIFKDIETYIDCITTSYLHNFLHHAFEDEVFRKKFTQFPAGKSIHHAYIPGLADHVLDMLHMADSILLAHPLANRDIVYTGIILHDIGKLEEFEEKNMVFDYSLKGNMLGHIFIGAEWFNKNVPPDFPGDLRTRVTHIILSHHGKKEMGSPVTPKTYEAIIVNKLDEISSSLNTIAKAYESYNGTNDFSERMPTLNNEILYLRPATNF